MKYLIFYLIVINIVGALVTLYDKIAAKKGYRRISEKALFIYAAIGASPLVYYTMKVIRHKTLHKRFMVGLPIIMILQILIAIAVLYFMA